jgi:sec-independent protein translocase protein TatB
MFDISWGELLIIGVVALVVIGPKELPGVLRTVGHWMAKVRRMASEFQDQFREAMREAELEELKKNVDDISASTTGYTSFDPVGTIRNEFESAVGEPPRLDEPLPDSRPAQPPPAPPSGEVSTEAQPAAAASDQPPSADTRKTGDAA